MLKKIPVKVNTPEWLALKQNYIGCSDIPVLTGSNRSYQSPIQIFYQKIGIEPLNLRMAEIPFMGHVMEPVILNMWRYYEREQRDIWVQNMLADRVMRECEHNTGYIVVNEDTPFISTTPDAIMEPGCPTLFGEVLKVASPINAKNINSIKWHQYEGYVPEHHEQMQGEMLVWGAQYAELACLVGGNEFHVLPIERDEAIVKSIYNICKDFWYNKVLPAKPLADRWKATQKKSEKDAIMHDIYQLEPDADETDHYRIFVASRFVNKEKKAEASESLQKLMELYQFYNDVGKGIKSKQNLIKNTILRVHEHNGYSLIQGRGAKSSFNKKHVISGPELSPKEIEQIVINLTQ